MDVKERRKIYLRALESGDYRQTRRYYTNVEGEFCALGVAAHVAGEYYDIDWGELIPVGENSRVTKFLDVDEYELRHIVYLNDRLKKTFPEIAKSLRKKWDLE